MGWVPESVSDHGDLTGLADDDHIQYFNETRHDADDHSALQIVEAQITDLDHTDVDAVHVDQAGEIIAVTEKATPVPADLLLIEDSEAANAKKRVQIGNLPGGGASALDDLTDVAITTPTTGQVLKYDGSGWVNDTDDTGSGSLPTASTKGDIAVYDGSAWVVVAAGTNDHVLTADSAQAAGVKWATPSGGGGAPVYPFSGVDAEPASPDAMDDHFDGSSLDAKWTTLNIGSATQVFEHSTLGFEVNENVNQWRGIYQAAPSGDWTVRAKILPAGYYVATTYLGLFAAASTTGEVRTIVLGNSTFVWGTSYTAPTNSASSWGTQRSVYPSAMYFEMEWDDSAGTLYTRASRTGLDNTFDLQNSVSLGYTPAIVGLGFANRTGNAARFPFDWFRRVA